jgi:ubiquitin-conjugating enzyme E2 J2
MGLLSFMTSSEGGVGSVSSNDDVKRRCAAESLEYNCKNKDFCKLFPDLVARHKAAQEAARRAQGSGGEAASQAAAARDPASSSTPSSLPKYIALLGGLALALYIALKMRGDGGGVPNDEF